ncbi:MAG: FAD-dependent oxidoreductase [Armatimonadetes bacterium]|nr:FAD-dependent oxidoreductase [Armatimonadota bacterium]
MALAQVPVVVPDLGYWKSQIKCQAACPVHTDARGYVRAIADGDYEKAYLIARGPNPLASLCGRICGAPCEDECRRGDLDRPIQIRALKRFACEQFGPESGKFDAGEMIEFLKSAATKDKRQCSGSDELLPMLQSVMKGDVPLVSGKSVGVIGSGPAGLSAAHDLALLGFEVTIYEMEPVLAGMLAVGVPEYRLPRDLIRAEVDVILAMGVKAFTDCEVGKDVTLAELSDWHDAVVIAVGAKKSRNLQIPGADGPGVVGGVEFLRDVAVGEPVELGRKVVVIGGGSVAYDVGRTVLRQIASDIARTAMREESVSEVTLCSLESLGEMPAEDAEIIQGGQEGIVRRNSLGPAEILRDESGKVKGVVFNRCLSVFDEDGRFSPKFDEDDKETIECDQVLIAIGQQVDLPFLDPDGPGPKANERGFIDCDPETGKTDVPGFFVAGDLAYGTKLMIHAIASGKAVARSVYEHVTGKPIQYRDVELHFAEREYDREIGYEGKRRVAISTTDAERRIESMGAPVEVNFTEEQARAEASRCLDCGVNTVFDGDIFHYHDESGANLRSNITLDRSFRMAMAKIADYKEEDWKRLKGIGNFKSPSNQKKRADYRANFTCSVFEFPYYMRLRAQYRDFAFIDGVTSSETAEYFNTYYNLIMAFYEALDALKTKLVASRS